MNALFTTLLLLVGLFGDSCLAHVRLTFPPARQPDYDFLDNVRTGGPCGVPENPNSPVTTFLTGSTINVTFHLAYPHRGGILVNILDMNGTILHALLGTQWNNREEDATLYSHEVLLPTDFECERCTLQLVREAAEWTAPGGRYLFWSCADVTIINSSSDAACNGMSCSGHGNCENGECVCDRLYSGQYCHIEDECLDASDCNNQGSCVDLQGISFPRRQCFCSPGWFGNKCSQASSLTDPTINPEDYTLRSQLHDRLVLYARIVDDELEVALMHNGTGYVAVGWKPSRGIDGSCRAQSPGAFNVGANSLWANGQSWPIIDGADSFYNQFVRPNLPNGTNIDSDDNDDGAIEEGGGNEEVGANEEGGADEEGRTIDNEDGATEEGAGNEEGGSEEGGSEEGNGQAPPLHPMDCSDVIIGVARGNQFQVFDYYTRDRSTPRRDTFYGGEDSITAAVGKEENGFTFIKWRRPLVTNDDSADHPISNELTTLIWSFGQVYPDYFHFPASGIEAGTAQNDRFYQPDEIKYHGTRNRGSTSINFFDENNLPLDPAQCRGEFSTGCNDQEVCDYRARWTVVGEEVEFTVSSRTSGSSDAEWVGIGFSDDRMMPMSDAVVGSVDESGYFVTDRYITMRAEPPVDNIQHVTETEVTIDGGIMTMKFTRPLITGDSNDLSLNECRFFLFGWGGSANIESKSIGYHPNTPIVSADKICLPTPQQCPVGIGGDFNGAVRPLYSVFTIIVGTVVCTLVVLFA